MSYSPKGTRLNHCRGSGEGGHANSQGGASWTNRARCSWCGKTVRVTQQGRLQAHGTRVPKETPNA